MLNQEEREELDHVRSQLEVLRSLVKSPGWGLLAEYLTGQTELRRKSIGITPIASIEEALRRNLEIGVTMGLEAIPTILKSKIEDLKERQVSLMRKDRGEEDAA